MRLTITTWYQLEENDHIVKYQAQTSNIDADAHENSLSNAFVLHQEKIGAIERKLLKAC